VVNNRSKRGKNIGMIVAITAIFTALILLMLWQMQVKAQEVIKINQELQIEQEQNQELQDIIKEIEKQNEEINNELEELKEELERIELSKKQNDPNQKIAYLTFDDGPSDNTLKILDVLKQKNVPATFFVIGNEGRKDVYKRIIDEGHVIGNHTYGHDYKGIYKSPQTFFADVDKLNDLLEEVTGERTQILRFPGGSNNTVSRHAGGSGIMDEITKAAIDNGYKYFDWNVDSQDASKAVQSKDVIVKSVLNGSSQTNKAVILMHDAPAKTTTVEALPEIIEGLRAKGFIFKSLDEYSPGAHLK